MTFSQKKGKLAILAMIMSKKERPRSARDDHESKKGSYCSNLNGTESKFKMTTGGE